jgi:tRNA pseudouridine38-40 synthase
MRRNNGVSVVKNYRMTIQYDGTSYNGWQKQKNTTNTIQTVLEETLSVVLQEDIQIQGSGRTDAGVHAYGQTANFKCKSIQELKDFLLKINKKLPPDIKMVCIQEVSKDFHSRLSAVSKIYSYHIANGQRPSVFRRKYLYHYEKELNLELMRSAANQLMGTHDFRAFSSEKNPMKSCIRCLYDITIEKRDNEIVIRYFGNGFLYNMARILTGTLLEIGAGDRKMVEFEQIFYSGNRKFSGFLAPPNGLFLERVIYTKEEEAVLFTRTKHLV